MKITKYIFEPVIEDGKHVFKIPSGDDWFINNDGEFYRGIESPGTPYVRCIYKRTEEEVEIPDPPMRKKIYVEIEGNDNLNLDRVIHAIECYAPSMDATYNIIDSGWTDEDMQKFIVFCCGVQSPDVRLDSFKHYRNKNEN